MPFKLSSIYLLRKIYIKMYKRKDFCKDMKLLSIFFKWSKSLQRRWLSAHQCRLFHHSWAKSSTLLHEQNTEMLKKEKRWGGGSECWWTLCFPFTCYTICCNATDTPQQPNEPLDSALLGVSGPPSWSLPSWIMQDFMWSKMVAPKRVRTSFTSEHHEFTTAHSGTTVYSFVTIVLITQERH